jgi:hypothetical protein
MAEKQTKQQQMGIWIPVSILAVGILATFFTISRNGRNGYFKLK